VKIDKLKVFHNCRIDWSTKKADHWHW